MNASNKDGNGQKVQKSAYKARERENRTRQGEQSPRKREELSSRKLIMETIYI
jgi:hypothetical protein